MRYKFRSGGPLFLLSTLGLVIGLTGASRADFLPGRIYLSGVPYDHACDDRIYEFDPATGVYQLFLDLPDELCGSISGLAFTPDGSRLRASVFSTSWILEIDGDGAISQALGPPDGIVGPFGSNNIGYNASGDFFVSNFNRRILRFPAKGGPAELYGDAADGVGNYGPIALAPNGDLYYGVARSNTFRDIIRFTGAGESELFDTIPQGNLHSLAVDSAGNIFALTAYGLFRYDAGDPSTRRLLPAPLGASIAFSPDESTLYVARWGSGNEMFAVDPQTGSYTSLGTMGGEHAIGAGIAVAVPEPAQPLVFFLAVALALSGPRFQEGYS